MKDVAAFVAFALQLDDAIGRLGELVTQPRDLGGSLATLGQQGRPQFADHGAKRRYDPRSDSDQSRA